MNGMRTDERMITKACFAHDPASCIAAQTAERFAALLRQTPDVRRAMHVPRKIALPEERSPVLRRVSRPPVEAWHALELRWDISLSEPGVYSSIHVFLLDSQEVLCVLRARDGGLMLDRRIPAQQFAMLFLRAWVQCRGTSCSDARAMNAELRDVAERIFQEHVVPCECMADTGLCRSLLALLR